MILYLDSSALVKRYVVEPGSDDIASLISDAPYTGTASISHTEVIAALAEAVRMRMLTPESASDSRRLFLSDWPALIRVQITDFVIVRASEVAWEYGLRGYDSVQLAAATTWADALAQRVTFATFDRQLWSVAERIGMDVYPLEPSRGEGTRQR